MTVATFYLDPRTGGVRFLYGEAAAAIAAGGFRCSAERASHVEPDAEGNWWADLSPVGGPRLGPFPFDRRDVALAEEARWLTENLLEKGIEHAG